MRYHIIEGNGQYHNLFSSFGKISSFHKADVIVFTGGEDVTPTLYGGTQHPQTMNNVSRDMREISVFTSALAMGKKMVGICRGGQFLNVMSGGVMYQHCTDHCRNHVVQSRFGTFDVTSTHHQIMVPGVAATTLATSGHEAFCEIGFQDGYEKVDTAEVLYYEHTKALCFQPHPEFSYAESTKELFKLCLEFGGMI